MTALSPVAATLYDKINAAPSPDELTVLQDAIWRRHWGVDLSDAEAQFLAEAIEQRKPRCREFVAAKALAKLNGRVSSRFAPRQRPRSPDRKASRDRRRRLGGSSVLPNTLRHHYTEGQRAVLCIIAGEVKHHGVCDLPIDKIAALAGVCRTTVQTTLHEARRLGHIRITERPVRGRKNLSNLVEIMSAEWRTWIKRGPTAHRPIGSKTVNLASTTKNTDLKQVEIAQPERPKGALQWERRAGSAPPNEPWKRGAA